MTEYIIGLDYGSASARGVLIDLETGREVASHTHAYRHDTLTNALPDGTPLPQDWALQVAPDYTEAAEEILRSLGKGRRVRGIGIGFTASSPLPAQRDGTPLSELHPDDPHAYVKLWKHGAAQAQAARINAAGGAHLNRFGGKVSSEWLLAKAAQIAEDAPASWARTERFIEAGDWLVWQLTGQERRSMGFAAYKAQFDLRNGYPTHLVPGLESRLSDPLPIGSKAGDLTADWCARTGILGPCVIAVAVIDSHVVLPAIGAVEDGCFVGALGTSAVSMMLSQDERPLPEGIEGAAFNGTLPGLWCYEAGQASFGDMLSWFVKTIPHGDTPDASFDYYNRAAAAYAPGQNRMLVLDWWNGNRVPHADSALSGVMLGLTQNSQPAGMYRALIEALCLGMRSVLELYEGGGFEVRRVIMTSGLALRNPFLVQTMADVLGRDIEVPAIANPTAVGAAIHGAVAAGIVANFQDGANRFGATSSHFYTSDQSAFECYSKVFAHYKALCSDPAILSALRRLSEAA